MPLYEYQCESCEHRFEKIQKYTDPAPDACPKCGGTVRKLASSPAIQFKGTGWYITDYAKKTGADAGKSSSGSETTEKSAGSDTAGAAEKPATTEKPASTDTSATKTDTPASTKTT